MTLVEPIAGILLGALTLGLIHHLGRRRAIGKFLRYALAGFPLFVGWILVAILLSILFVAIEPLRHLMTTRAFLIDQSQLPPTTKDMFDELKWMLTILAGFAVVTSIAQAVAAWVSALTYDKQAAAKLKEIEANALASNNLANAKLAEIDKVLESVKARYPLFYDVEEKRNLAHEELINGLRRVFSVPNDVADSTEAINYMKDIYSVLDVETRQLVLSVESFASIDLHPPVKGNAVDNLKLFAVFYHAKYRYEETLNGTVSLGDLERAEGYLKLALRKANQDFTLRNELGNVYITAGESVINAGKVVSLAPSRVTVARQTQEGPQHT